jgi:hypothetical protein
MLRRWWCSDAGSRSSCFSSFDARRWDSASQKEILDRSSVLRTPGSVSPWLGGTRPCIQIGRGSACSWLRLSRLARSSSQLGRSEPSERSGHFKPSSRPTTSWSQRVPTDSYATRSIPACWECWWPQPWSSQITGGSPSQSFFISSGRSFAFTARSRCSGRGSARPSTRTRTVRRRSSHFSPKHPARSGSSCAADQQPGKKHKRAA